MPRVTLSPRIRLARRVGLTRAVQFERIATDFAAVARRVIGEPSE